MPEDDCCHCYVSLLSFCDGGARPYLFPLPDRSRLQTALPTLIVAGILPGPHLTGASCRMSVHLRHGACCTSFCQGGSPRNPYASLAQFHPVRQMKAMQAFRIAQRDAGAKPRCREAAEIQLLGRLRHAEDLQMLLADQTVPTLHCRRGQCKPACRAEGWLCHEACLDARRMPVALYVAASSTSHCTRLPSLVLRQRSNIQGRREICFLHRSGLVGQA